MPSPPAQHALRSRLFWVARWLLGCGSFYDGPLEIVIRDGPAGRCGHACVCKPQPDDDRFEADGPPSAHGAAPTAPHVLAHLLSEDGLTLMRFIAHRGPVAAKVITAAVGIERSKCYVLLCDLRDRGLIHDRGRGYAIADPALWAAIQSARPSEVACAAPTPSD